jgi:hypothetical protein
MCTEGGSPTYAPATGTSRVTGPLVTVAFVGFFLAGFFFAAGFLLAVVFLLVVFFTGRRDDLFRAICLPLARFTRAARSPSGSLTLQQLRHRHAEGLGQAPQEQQGPSLWAHIFPLGHASQLSFRKPSNASLNAAESTMAALCRPWGITMSRDPGIQRTAVSAKIL